jgi:pimeloyl-ACP methyl ester carboxylesterase
VDPTFTPSHRGGSGPPLVLLHGFTGSWRVWELVLPYLERHHDVLAPTLPGHAGGPHISGDADAALMPDAVERAMDAAGFGTAHVVGNSLGGHVALQLAARGRAESVVALAPAGGWAVGDGSFNETLDFFVRMQPLAKAAAPNANAIAATPEGRRQVTAAMVTNSAHIPPALVAGILRSAAACDGMEPLLDVARRVGWPLEADKIECPVRMVWGTADKLLPWPSAAARFRNDWLPHADWVELDGVGHCPQLDVPLETAELILGFTAR